MTSKGTIALRRISTGAAVVAALVAPGGARAASTSGKASPRRRPVATVSLSDPGLISRYAFVEESVLARSRPSRGARAVDRLTTSTYWGTSQIVLALAQTRTGESWTLVRLPVPGDPTGWVPTSALSAPRVVHTWLKVDRERLTATLIHDGKAIFSAPIGVGQRQWPTPAGQFFVEESLTPPSGEGVYGPLAFGTSARSNVLTEWPNGGQIGVHGTNEPWLIPGRISHGCVRLRDKDILRLGRLMPVGTPITIY